LLNRNKEFVIKPIVIEDPEVCLYGIFRGEENPLKIVVFVPALTGTRIGPQRMFVEISNHLNRYKISVICFDFPLAGDSIDKRGIEYPSIRVYYNNYLSKIHNQLKQKYLQSEIVYSSISVGCMPILEFSEKNNIDRVLLLSPNHLSNQTSFINIGNVNAYFIKILQFKTWEKFFLMKLDFNKIFSNIFNTNKKKKSQKVRVKKQIEKNVGKVNLLCIFGENDLDLKRNRLFWTLNKKQNRFISYEERIVPNSDHSFMGWKSKMQLITYITDWLN
jgi:hypothetical protein